MAAGATYFPIATTTLTSNQASVTFSSISGSYTDLVLIIGNYGATVTGSYSVTAVLNSDTASNYSYTILTGNGSTAASYRGSNNSRLPLGMWDYMAGTNTQTIICNFNNYSNTTTNKTVVTRYNNAAGETGSYISMWRNTNAINSISIRNGNANTDSGNILSGTTFTLYGIEYA